jgi:hypothetical protein
MGYEEEDLMRVSPSKSVLAPVVAVVLSAIVGLATVPADAAFFHGGGGFHGGGFGGFHGGGFGGFRGGRFGGYYGRCWNCGYGWLWPGFAAGALLGAAATYPYFYGYGYPYYGYGYPYYGAGYPNGCLVYRRVYNRRGRYIGRGLVNICN